MGNSESHFRSERRIVLLEGGHTKEVFKSTRNITYINVDDVTIDAMKQEIVQNMNEMMAIALTYIKTHRIVKREYTYRLRDDHTDILCLRLYTPH